MKTYQCIAHHGNTGKQIVITVRAVSATSASAEALKQARQQFGSSGAVTIVSVKEV